MKKLKRLGRRQLLVGAGGFTLALPILPSLLSSEARAQTHQPKRFIAIASSHGGVPAADMYPADGAATETLELFPGHVAHHGELPRTESGSTAYLSPVLRAPADVLTAQLASKINVVRGLGIMKYMGHHRGGHLGNLYRGGGAVPEMPTIDQVMAWSDSFYPDLSSIGQRSIHVDGAGPQASGISMGFSDPANGTGSVEPVLGETSSLDLFDRLFGAVGMAPSDAPRRPVVDRVLEHYRGMTSGRFGDAQRMSASDRRRLEEHMERMAELQRRLESRGAVSCGPLTRPESGAGHARGALKLTNNPVDRATNAEWYSHYNEVVATAIMCNVTGIATFYARGSAFADGYAGNDWHERVAHAGDTERLGEMVNGVFEHVFLDLARRLDVEEADGRTYLDNSLIQYTQESGHLTHFALEVPLVTAGSAGGALRTGRFIDYRYRESLDLVLDRWIGGPKGEFRAGLSWNQYISTVLLAMGLSRSEFEDGVTPGYSDITVEDRHARGFHSGIVAAAGDPLPLLAI